jgi:hypothetical protein
MISCVFTEKIKITNPNFFKNCENFFLRLSKKIHTKRVKNENVLKNFLWNFLHLSVKTHDGL